MKRINAVIVDDETSSVHTLRNMLAEFCPMVYVCSAAGTIDQGVQAVQQYQPDVVFLDIEMPPTGNGFDLLEKTEGIPFGVIFTTAYAHYAIRAINEAQPWGFLVKPFRASDLVHALHVATVKMNRPGADTNFANRGTILTDMRKGNVVVRYADILYCQADGPCTVFYIRRNDKIEQVPVYRTLKDIELELPDELFCRVHHSTLVNMTYIQRFERQGRGGVAFLPNDSKVEVSVQKMEYFMQHFGEFLRGFRGK